MAPAPQSARRNKTATQNSQSDLEIGDDLDIISEAPRDSAPGTWVRGSLNGYRFDALVFSEHAKIRDWELAGSRIAKLWLKRLSDGKVVFNWDRGQDVPAENVAAWAIADFLCAGLARPAFRAWQAADALPAASGRTTAFHSLATTVSYSP